MISDLVDTWLVHGEEREQYMNELACQPIPNPLENFLETPINMYSEAPWSAHDPARGSAKIVSLVPFLKTLALFSYLSCTRPEVKGWYLCRLAAMGQGITDYYSVIPAESIDSIFPAALVSRASIEPNKTHSHEYICLDCPVACPDLANYLEQLAKIGFARIIDSRIFIHYCAAIGTDIQCELMEKYMIKH